MAAVIFAWSFTDHIILVLRPFFKIFLQGKQRGVQFFEIVFAEDS
jgi:hypothetical protein